MTGNYVQNHEVWLVGIRLKQLQWTMAGHQVFMPSYLWVACMSCALDVHELV